LPTTQPASTTQNTGLVVIVVGIFMVIIAFLAVTYLNSDAIRTNQDRNSQKGQQDRSDLTDITCVLWRSVGDPGKISQGDRDKVQAVCGKG
jgi:hypothetical protein